MEQEHDSPYIPIPTLKLVQLAGSDEWIAVLNVPFPGRGGWVCSACGKTRREALKKFEAELRKLSSS
jgi:hypothetical protein